MDAIPQGGSSQAQGLAGLFLPAGGPTAKDGKAFGTELTKYIDDASPIQQSHMGGKPERNKDKKDDDGSSHRQQADIEVPLVVPAMMLALNLTPAIAITPAGIESATGVPSNTSATPAAVAITQDIVDVVNGGTVKDVDDNSGLKARLVAGRPSGEAVDGKSVAGPIEQVQTADPNEVQKVHAAKDDHRQSAKAGSKGAETPVTDTLLNTVRAEPVRASSSSAESVQKNDILSRPSGEVHENKKEVAGSERRQPRSVTSPEAATPPTDQTEQPAPVDAGAQATPSLTIVTGSGAVSAAAEEIKAGGLTEVRQLQQKESIEPLQPKPNDGKSAPPADDPKAIKDRKDDSEERKRVEQHDGAATAQTGTQLDEQVKQGLAKVNAEKPPDIVPGMHPAANTPNVPADMKHFSGGQPHETGQMSAPEIAAPVSTPAEVVHAVRMFERDGQAEMHIGVRSETFGTIDLKATVHDCSVGVSIGVERHEVRSALVSELPGLENTLREHDLRLGEVRFHDTGSTLASEYGNGQQRQSPEFSRPPASVFYRAAKSSSESNELPVEMVTTIARRGISVHV